MMEAADWDQKRSWGQRGVKTMVPMESPWSGHMLGVNKHCQITGGYRWMKETVHLPDEWQMHDGFRFKGKSHTPAEEIVSTIPWSACLKHRFLGSMSFCWRMTKVSLIICFTCSSLPWPYRQFSSRYDHQNMQRRDDRETNQNDVCGKYHCHYEWSNLLLTADINSDFVSRVVSPLHIWWSYSWRKLPVRSR